MHRGSRVFVVIPAHNEAPFIGAVLAGLPAFVDAVIVVDDASTDGTAQAAAADARATVVRLDRNVGVGGATVEGYRLALARGADIVVKMDGDGQMSADDLPALLDALIDSGAAYVKGNRFMGTPLVGQMPSARLVGNILLTFLNKVASGYWHVFDPQNGFTAIRASTLSRLPLERLHQRFFFENDMLVHLNILGARVLDVGMPARYGQEVSKLSISRVLVSFPGLLLRRLGRRIVQRYVVRDFSPVALFLLVGIPVFLGGLGYSLLLWVRSFETGLPTPTGSLMIALLALLFGFQLLLLALVLDIQGSPK